MKHYKTSVEFFFNMAGTVTEGAVKKDAECVKVDFNHTHLKTLTCELSYFDNEFHYLNI